MLPPRKAVIELPWFFFFFFCVLLLYMLKLKYHQHSLFFPLAWTRKHCMLILCSYSETYIWQVERREGLLNNLLKTSSEGKNVVIT